MENVPMWGHSVLLCIPCFSSCFQIPPKLSSNTLSQDLLLWESNIRYTCNKAKITVKNTCCGTLTHGGKHPHICLFRQILFQFYVMIVCVLEEWICRINVRVRLYLFILASLVTLNNTCRNLLWLVYESHSVMSDSLQPNRVYLARLLLSMEFSRLEWSG